MWCNVAQPLGSSERLWEFAASLPHAECNMRNGALKRIKQALKIPLAAQQQGRQRCFSVNNSCVMSVKYLFKYRENIRIFVCRSVVVVSEVSLPLPRLPPPPHHEPLPSPSLAFLVMRCRWAETRPHVSAGFAASSAPIISSLPWHRAQRQLTARHLTAVSHAWTPDTVTGRTKSAVSCWNTQFKVRSVFTNRLTGKLPGREVPSNLNHCCLCATKSRSLWVTFLQRKSLNRTNWTA